jgi:hypothetical protein
MQRLDQPLAGASSIEPAAEDLKSTGETYVFDYALRPEVDLRARTAPKRWRRHIPLLSSPA